MLTTSQQLWADADFPPNTEREKAVRHICGSLYLPACAGSGKTRVLLWRTPNLIVFKEVADGGNNQSGSKGEGSEC